MIVDKVRITGTLSVWMTSDAVAHYESSSAMSPEQVRAEVMAARGDYVARIETLDRWLAATEVAAKK